MNPGPTCRYGSGAGFCTDTCDVAVWDSPPQCIIFEVLRCGAALRCVATAVDRMCWKHPGIVAVPGCKCPGVRVRMRGGKWGQRTERWLVKAWRKLSSNSV